MFNIIIRPFDLRARYDAAATTWHARMDALGYSAAYRAAIAELCPQGLTVRRVMDVGCGAGDFAAAYAALRPRPDVLTLADPSVAMLHEAKLHLQGAADEVVVLKTALDDLPMHPSQDVILCAHVIDHCPDPVHALRILGQRLSQGGTIILIATRPHWCNRLIRPLWRHHSHSPARILQAVVAAGLVCPRDTGFASGPPRRTSHAYLITLTQPEMNHADRHR
ncbi:MAG: class I SAM-dependent methyltransferase [Rhodobacterales bacterium]|nr:class I SAM-dependent methyltransferase [Rhodobacterales bacterium]